MKRRKRKMKRYEQLEIELFAFADDVLTLNNSLENADNVLTDGWENGNNG